MKKRKNILFIILELLSGVVIGILTTYLLIPYIPILDLNLSIIVGFLIFAFSAVIGIGIPGFFHSLIKGNYSNFGIGIGKATIGVLLGLLLSGILSAMTSSLLPNGVSALLIPVLTTVLCGVIGFNYGIKPQLELNEK